MLLRQLRHIRNNAVAYIALFVALTGTSYAAFRLPAGSIGTRELENRAITAAKLSPTSIAANVRAWAVLQWTGVWRVQSSTRDIRVVSTAQGEQVSWRHTRFASNCMASVTPLRNFPGPAGNVFPNGYVTTAFDPSAGFLTIFGIAQTGSFQVQSVNILIVCPSRGSQKVNR